MAFDNNIDDDNNSIDMASISTNQSRQQQQKQAHKSQSDASVMNGTSKLDEQLNDDLKNIDEKRTLLKSKIFKPLK